MQVINEEQFIEYTKNGYPTTFTITVVEPHKRWEFDMENSNMKGHWVGIFTSIDDKTEIDFTEQVTAKKFYMTPTKRNTKVISFSNICYFIAITFTTPIIFYYIVFLEFTEYIF